MNKNNQIEIKDDYAILKIHSETHGDFDILIDIDDVEEVSKHIWFINKFRGCGGYYKHYVINNKHTLIHRLIMKPEKGLVVDHINGDGLDNRKENMRICTRAENRHNSGKYINNKSGHKGVFLYKYTKVPKWVAHIEVDKKRTHLGYFDDYEEACRARDEAELEYYGEYAKLED